MKQAIFIQGAPGVGKTTLAQRLGEDLGVRVFSKDFFKEAMFDTVGLPATQEESKLYGRIALRSIYAALKEYVQARKLIIVEAPVEPLYATIDFEQWNIPLDELLQLHVFCDPVIQEKRFARRVGDGSRHIGHGDSAIEGAITQRRNQPVEGMETINVDTTAFSDEAYRQLLASVRERIGGGP